MFMPNIAQGLSLEMLLLVIIGFIWCRSIRNLQTESLRAFFRLCSALMLFLIIDIPVRLSDLDLVSWNPTIVYMLNALYIGLETLTVFEWFEYFVTVQGTDIFNTKFRKFIEILPMAIMLVLLVVSYKTGWLFYIDENGAYTRGSMFFLQFLIPYSYLIASFISTFIGLKKNVNRRTTKILLAAFIPAIVTSVMQVIFSGSFTHMGLCFVVILMYIEMFQEETKQIENEKKAYDIRSSFLSRMSHDMRTPLNGILGLIEINDRNPDDVELLAANRNKCKAAANHLLSLINDVLDMSKLEGGKVELAHEAFCISDMIDDVIAIVKPKADNAGVSVAREETEDTFRYPHTYGSPLHIRRVLLNIMDNAIKYNKENGSVSIGVEHEFSETGCIKYVISITDTGIGMKEEYVSRIFDPFSQEHIDAKSVYEGTGLGMAITKSMVDIMGGTIDVTSRLGEGSTFVISLTLDILPDEDIETVEKTPDCIDISGINVLLVEDNELNAEIATVLLEEFGVSVDLAVNGQEAVDTFSENPEGTFDVILMDCMMPVLDGYDATKAIREMSRPDAGKIPVIAMTANAYAEDVKKCLDAGMNAHIAKPFDITNVAETISRHVHTKNS